MRLSILFLAGLCGIQTQFAAEPANEYLNFVREQAAELHRRDLIPQTAPEWNRFKASLRDRLGEAWGDPRSRLGKMEVRSFGELLRDGYRVEKLTIQTFPGVWMTANAYVPAEPRPARLPAILMVHGHWRGAKQDPVVQARCIGAVKKGFFVLVVDAFGAGERGVGKALGEYHGDMTAATLLPVGLPLSGLQVAENTRALDYLVSRPEVDAARIGITGASGGGNQTMYAAAWDDRFLAAAPVCSVGNYQAYLGAACCYCELVPGALRFTEEWAVLGMTAPRALLVINATGDSRQFSVDEAKTSLAQTKTVFNLLGQPAYLRHTTFESGHDYSKPMREAVYGWMTLHLKEQGDGSPIVEDPFQPEDPEQLRCFPGNTRPDDWITIPRFAEREARLVLAARAKAHGEQDPLPTVALRNVLGGFPVGGPVPFNAVTNAAGSSREITFKPEAGITLRAHHKLGTDTNRLIIVLDLAGEKHAATNEVVALFSEQGWNVITLDLRATGSLEWPSDKVGRAPDHTTAQWGFWIGRPLAGQWVWDVRRLLDVFKQSRTLPKDIAIAGIGPAGVVALCTAALDERVTRALTFGTLATYVTDLPYEKERMGILIPGILKQVGDIPELAGMVAPKPLLIAGAVKPTGDALNDPALKAVFKDTEKRYAALSRSKSLQFSSEDDRKLLLEFLNSRVGP